MTIAKRHPPMHRQFVREPGIASHCAGKVSVVLVSLLAVGAAAAALSHRAPEHAASAFALETGAASPSALADATEHGLAAVDPTLIAARDHYPEPVVDDANARVIDELP